jgi:hypothetical protein
MRRTYPTGPRVGGEGGSSLDKVASFQYCRMGRAR